MTTMKERRALVALGVVLMSAGLAIAVLRDQDAAIAAGGVATFLGAAIAVLGILGLRPTNISPTGMDLELPTRLDVATADIDDLITQTDGSEDGSAPAVDSPSLAGADSATLRERSDLVKIPDPAHPDHVQRREREQRILIELREQIHAARSLLPSTPPLEQRYIRDVPSIVAEHDLDYFELHEIDVFSWTVDQYRTWSNNREEAEVESYLEDQALEEWRASKGRR